MTQNTAEEMGTELVINGSNPLCAESSQAMMKALSYLRDSRTPNVLLVVKPPSKVLARVESFLRAHVKEGVEALSAEQDNPHTIRICRNTLKALNPISESNPREVLQPA